MISATPITVEFTLSTHKRIRQLPSESNGERVPRLARLMALAIKFDMLIREGVVRDYADLARLGHVSRARITQIMNLLNLAPDIQDQLLSLSSSSCCERDIRKLTGVIDWATQRRIWDNAPTERGLDALSSPRTGLNSAAPETG